jgi:hypothetical protein
MLKKSKLMHQAILLFIFCIFLCSCAQQKKMIKKVHAFYIENVPGIIQADENGIPLPYKIDTVIVVYVETTSKEITWDSAWNHTKQFKIISQQIDSKNYEAGFIKGTTEKVFITAAPDHLLYQLQLQPINKKKILNQDQVEIEELLLRGKYKNKFFFQKAGKIRELEANPPV